MSSLELIDCILSSVTTEDMILALEDYLEFQGEKNV